MVTFYILLVVFTNKVLVLQLFLWAYNDSEKHMIYKAQIAIKQPCKGTASRDSATS